MADDLANSLSTYKVQLTQVEAALASSPDNDELLKLKQDLLEVGYCLSKKFDLVQLFLCNSVNLGITSDYSTDVYASGLC